MRYLSGCAHQRQEALREGLCLNDWRGNSFESGLQSAQAGVSGDAPKVSVIVPNYNNEIYLDKCLTSLVGQTLHDIEIIVVDDGSTDDSVAVVKAFANRDQRVNLISLQDNMSLHMARKAGVAAATGNYIMFLDSDDYYLPDACHKAFEAINGKYDFVEFNLRLLTPSGGDHAGDYELAQWLNRGKPCAYEGYAIIRAIYYEHGFTDIVSNKIFAAVFLKAAFAEMKDIYMLGGEDNYEGVVLFSRAKSAAKIGDYIYVYRRGSGTTSGRAAPAGREFAPLRLEAYKAIEEYAIANNLNIHLEWIRSPFLDSSVAWFKGAFAGFGLKPLKMTAECFGIAEVIATMAKQWEYEWEVVAKKYFSHKHQFISKRPIKRVGIIIHNLDSGGSQHVALNEAIALRESGYEITFFLCEPGGNESKLPTDIRRVYCGRMDYNQCDLKKRLHALNRSLMQEKMDIILYHSSWDRALLWHMILFQYYQIPVIVFNHTTFYNELLNEGSNYGLVPRQEVLKCADGVIVLSRTDELYYRCLGINAQAIPNPVPIVGMCVSAEDRESEKRDTIIVVGRFGDLTKNIKDCLLAFAEIIKKKPTARMLFAGNFVNAGAFERDFHSLAVKLGIIDRIEMSGWQENMSPFFNKACAMLSTAWHESFCLSAVEAQAHGLPVVLYDLPIMPAEDNPSMIRVPIGNYKAAAAEIVALLENGERLRELSVIAKKEGRKYSPQRHIKALDKIIKTFQFSSPVSWYSPQEYDTLLRVLGFYGAHVPPWFNG